MYIVHIIGKNNILASKMRIKLNFCKNKQRNQEQQLLLLKVSRAITILGAIHRVKSSKINI
jgi:hypothetical protein